MKKRSTYMELPKWNELFLPVLQAYAGGLPRNNRQVKIEVADGLGLSPELRNERTAKQQENKIEGRVGWAISGLRIAGLLENVERGKNQITPAGKELLAQRQGVNFDEGFLRQNYPAYEENLQRNRTRQRQGASSLEQERNLADATPEDLIDNAFGRLQASLREELLEYLRAMDVYQFEEVVADLLKKMGCGDLGDVWVTKKSNDEGIVGVLG